MYNIEFYEDKNGNCEIENYLKKLRKGLNKEDRIKLNKIRMYLNLLSDYGFQLNEPYIKKVEKDIWELRPLNDRIFFSKGLNNNTFILLNIFTKQSQKIPKNEIKKAKKILKDYKKRSEKYE